MSSTWSIITVDRPSAPTYFHMSNFINASCAMELSRWKGREGGRDEEEEREKDGGKKIERRKARVGLPYDS